MGHESITTTAPIHDHLHDDELDRVAAFRGLRASSDELAGAGDLSQRQVDQARQACRRLRRDARCRRREGRPALRDGSSSLGAPPAGRCGDRSVGTHPTRHGHMVVVIGFGGNAPGFAVGPLDAGGDCAPVDGLWDCQGAARARSRSLPAFRKSRRLGPSPRPGHPAPGRRRPGQQGGLPGQATGSTTVVDVGGFGSPRFSAHFRYTSKNTSCITAGRCPALSPSRSLAAGMW